MISFARQHRLLWHGFWIGGTLLSFWLLFTSAEGMGGTDLSARLLSADWDVMSQARVELQLLPADDIRRMIPTLRDALDASDMNTRNAAAYAFTAVAPYATKIVPDLVQAMLNESTSSFFREQLQQTLYQIGAMTPEGREVVRRAYRQAAAPARENMLLPMLDAGIADTTMLPAIALAIASDKDGKMIEAVAKQARRFGNEAAILVAPLIDEAKTCDQERCPYVVPDVMYALGEIGNAARDALPFFDGYAQDRNRAIRWHVALARHKIAPTTPIDFKPMFEEWASREERAACAFNNHTFEIVLRHESDEMTSTAWIIDKEMYLPVELGRWASTELKRFAPPETVKSVCDRTVAVPLNNRAILVMLLTSNRPFGDTMSVFVYDLVRRAVVAAAPNLGECAFEGTPRIEWAGDRLRFESRAQPSDSVACHQDCGVIGDHRIVQITDEPLPQWWEAKFLDGVLRTRVSAFHTWKHAPIRQFFRGQAEFERAFGYNATRQQFGINWYAVATLDGGRACLFPSPERGAPPDERYWRCPNDLQKKD